MQSGFNINQGKYIPIWLRFVIFVKWPTRQSENNLHIILCYILD